MTDQIFYIRQTLEKKLEYNDTVHQLFIDLKELLWFNKEALYNIFIEFGIPRKLVGLIKMCLNETCRRVWIGTNLSDKFPIQNDLKEEDTLPKFIFNFALEYAIRKDPRKSGRTQTEWNLSAFGLCWWC
jgi:hypothetical protein